MGRTAAAAVLVTAALAVTGCGGGSKDSPSTGTGGAGPQAAAPNQDARVIRQWSDLLRKGRVDAATGLFAVPATVQNGTAPLLLDTRRLVFGFNASLPCGAELLATSRRGPYTVGTFRLTQRPGGDCGTGGGQKAATAFRIENGKIVEWLRVPVPDPQPEPKKKPPPTDRPAPGHTV
jgi:hypothetical protein